MFALEQTFTEEPADPASSTDTVNDGEVTPEDAGGTSTYDQEGTDLTCDWTLDTKVNGEVADTATFKPGSEQTEIQVGGTLNLKKIWDNY